MSRYVAGKNDVWYTTNGMLFLNETVRNNISITEETRDTKFVFRVQLNAPLDTSYWNIGIALSLLAPGNWADKFAVEVITASPGRFEMGKGLGRVWIDVFSSEAKVELTHT